MGRGDRRTKRGKIWRGSTGKTRQRKKRPPKPKRKEAPPKPDA